MRKILTLCFLVVFECTALRAVADIPIDPFILSQVVPPSERILNIFDQWVVDTTAEIESRSELVNTPAGPIEYVIRYPKHVDPAKPIVLCLHGGFGGFDQGELIGADLVRDGFIVLSPSRPGYLRTPLSVGQTNAQQADAMVGLLDALGISKVAVLGFSAGAQVAFEFALRHPDRSVALVLQCIGAQPSQAAMYTLLTQILELDNGQVADFGSWLFYLFVKNDPVLAVALMTTIDTTLTSQPLLNRFSYVITHEHQIDFALDMAYTTMPLSPRAAGLINDIQGNLDPWGSYPYNLMTTPTMIIEARADSNGSYTEAQMVANQIKGVEFVTVEDSGHFIWLGPDTRRWERKLVKFLEAHGP